MWVGTFEASHSKSQLKAIIKYHRQEKDILAGRLEREVAGSVRLQIQHYNLKKELEEQIALKESLAAKEAEIND